VTPQSIHTLGGYRARGRSNDDFANILEGAKAPDRAGAFAIVIEAVSNPLRTPVRTRSNVRRLASARPHIATDKYSSVTICWA
jgi:ketopantoate hydroxymethyltransferase